MSKEGGDKKKSEQSKKNTANINQTPEDLSDVKRHVVIKRTDQENDRGERQGQKGKEAGPTRKIDPDNPPILDTSNSGHGHKGRSQQKK